NGFESHYPNVVPPVGKKPTDIISKKYATKTGIDYYIVPKEMVEAVGNGSRIRNGWKPTPDQIIQVRYDGQPVHEVLIERALSEGKLDPNSKIGKRVLADYPNLVEKFKTKEKPALPPVELSEP